MRLMNVIMIMILVLAVACKKDKAEPSTVVLM